MTINFPAIQPPATFTPSKQFLDGLESLNDDVQGLIFDQLPLATKVRLDRTYYIRHHHLLTHNLSPTTYFAYVIDTIDHDDAFVLERILDERFESFSHWRPFYTEYSTYSSCLVYLLNRSSSNNSTSCLALIKQYAERKGYLPNWYKSRNSMKLANRWKY